MKPMKPMNLTDAQRENMHVGFESGKFTLYCKEGFGMVFLSNYLDKEDFKADMKLNNIKPKMNHLASMKYLEQSGAF